MILEVVDEGFQEQADAPRGGCCWYAWWDYYL